MGDRRAVVAVPPKADCVLGGNAQSGVQNTPGGERRLSNALKLSTGKWFTELMGKKEEATQGC